MANTGWDDEIFGAMWKFLGWLFKQGGKAAVGAATSAWEQSQQQEKTAAELSTAELYAIAEQYIENMPSGVVFGKQDGAYICKHENTDGHVLVVGGVGSGKSSCIAIPTLQHWLGSVFAIDIKGELFTKADRYATTKIFNPLDENAYGYDPFFRLRTSNNPAQEALAIAQALIPLPPDTRDPFWITSAQNIFTAVILFCNCFNLSFVDAIKIVSGFSPKELIKILVTFKEKLNISSYISSYQDMNEQTLASIVAEITRNTAHFLADKNLLSALLRKKNITPEDLEFGHDVFIHIPEHLLRQWKNLLTLMVSQFLAHFEQRSEEKASPILFMLDEFPRLGKIPVILDGLATLRSKKITMCLAVQSLAQLDVIYGENERKVIADTCAYKAILSATDADTQEYFSRLVGTYDKRMTSHGTQKEAYTGYKTGTSTFTAEHERRIIKPEDFATLRDILLLTPYGAMRVDKAPYWLD